MQGYNHGVRADANVVREEALIEREGSFGADRLMIATTFKNQE